MPVFVIDHNTGQGYGLVLYVPADDKEQALAKIAQLEDYPDPVVGYLGDDEEIEARFYLYGQDLKIHRLHEEEEY